MADPEKTHTMEKFWEKFWFWVVQQVERQPLFKKWLLTLLNEFKRCSRRNKN